MLLKVKVAAALLAIALLAGCSGQEGPAPSSQPPAPMEASSFASVEEAPASSAASIPSQPEEAPPSSIPGETPDQSMETEALSEETGEQAERYPRVFYRTHWGGFTNAKDLTPGDEEALEEWKELIALPPEEIGEVSIHTMCIYEDKEIADPEEGWRAVKRLYATPLQPIDHIPVQHPYAFGRGVKDAEAFDHEGNRLWSVCRYGSHTALEMRDSGIVYVFYGELY